MSQYNSVASLDEVFQAILSRLDNLERTRVSHGSGAPSAGATEPYVDDTNNRVYFKVAGVWRFAALT